MLQDRHILNADSNFMTFTAQIGPPMPRGMPTWNFANYLVQSGIFVSVGKSSVTSQPIRADPDL